MSLSRFAQKEAYGRIIVAQKPQVRTIQQVGERRIGDVLRHHWQHLSFPHSLFVMYYTQGSIYKNGKLKRGGYHLSQLQIAFSTRPFTGTSKDKLYGLPLLNMNHEHTVCLNYWPFEYDVNTFVEKVIDLYWSSPFRFFEGYLSYWANAYDEQFLKQWLKNTKEKNYDWILEQHLIKSSTLGNVLAENPTKIKKSKIIISKAKHGTSRL